MSPDHQLLRESQIQFDVERGQWIAFRLVLTPAVWNASSWGPDEFSASLRTGVWIEAQPLDDYLWGQGWLRSERELPDFSFRTYRGEQSIPGGAGIGCSGACGSNPPTWDFAYMVGAIDGPIRLHWGVLPGQSAGELVALKARPVLEVSPDAEGRGVVAGSVRHTVHPNGTVKTEALGFVNVTRTTSLAAAPLFVQERIELSAGHTAPEAGFLWIQESVRADAAKVDFSYRVVVGGQELARSGTTTQPDLTEGLGILGINQLLPHARFNLQRRVPAAPIDIRMVTAHDGVTGASREGGMSFEWAFFSGDVPTLLGWPWIDKIPP